MSYERVSCLMFHSTVHSQSSRRGIFSCVYLQTSRISENNQVCLWSVDSPRPCCHGVKVLPVMYSVQFVTLSRSHPTTGPVTLSCVWLQLFVFSSCFAPDETSPASHACLHDTCIKKGALCCSVSCRDALCLCVSLQNKDFSFSSPPSSGNKHHQRSPGEQPGDGSWGFRSRAGDPENHRALLASARLQRRWPPHQRPGRGAHECKRQRRYFIHKFTRLKLFIRKGQK